MIGSTIGRYKILAKLGAGGMGVVWKAEDVRLKRTVALKFVAQEALESEDVKARLIREAQAAASLDHPNICAVHGIEEDDGRTFIAMAYVDGPSLSEKIRERPLPLDEALDIACQIAEGLQEAHERGIVHRDIKPENVMLTSRGQVKIMDFGLAALAGRSRITKSGTTLGTPAYMAPEQLEAGEVDRRADLWALGCVLYEMLTQRTPFEADYEQAIAYGILNEEPEPVTALRSGLPVEIDRVMGKALAKDKDARYQHADDFLVDLRALRKPSARTPLPAAESGPVQPTPSPKRWLPAAVAGALVGLAIGWLAGGTGAGPDPRSYHLELRPPPGIAYTAFALSPDGTRVAFIGEGVGSPKLWVQSLLDHSARAIEGTENADPVGTPFWSPDGEQVGFFADGKLKRVALGPGGVQTLCEAPFGRGGTWNDDGVIVYSPRNRMSELWRTTTSSGECRPVLSSAAGDIRNPQLLPDGRSLLANGRLQGGGAQLFWGSLTTGETTVLSEEIRHGVFATSRSTGQGYLLYEREGSVWARRLDTDDARLVGNEITMATGAGFGPMVFRGLLDVAGGILAYQPDGANSQQRQIGWFNRKGESIRDVHDAFTLGFTIDLSPDERWAIYWQLDAGRRSLLRLDLATGIATAVGSGGSPQIGPRGERIFYVSREGEIATISARGGEIRVLVPAPGDDGSHPLVQRSLCAVTANGSSVVFQSHSEETGWDLWTAPLSGGDPARLFDEPFDEGHAKLSPNDRWIAYVTNQSGSYEVYARAFPSGEGLERISLNGGRLPRWRSDGSEVFYLDESGMLMAVPVDWSGDAPQFGRAQSLFPVSSGYTNEEELSFYPGYPYDVSEDGQRFLALWRPPDMPFPPLQVITNWESRLKK